MRQEPQVFAAFLFLVNNRVFHLYFNIFLITSLLKSLFKNLQIIVRYILLKYVHCPFKILMHNDHSYFIGKFQGLIEY